MAKADPAAQAAVSISSVVFECKSVKDDDAGNRVIELVPVKQSSIQWGTETAEGSIFGRGLTTDMAQFVPAGLYQFDITQVG